MHTASIEEHRGPLQVTRDDAEFLRAGAPSSVTGARISIVISSLLGGGAERAASALAAHWVCSGLHVTVVTIASRDSDAYHLDPRVERVTLGLLRQSRNPLEGLLRSARRVVALRRVLTQLAPDVVVSFMGPTNVLSLLATAGTRRALFVCERSDPRCERIGAPWAALRRILYPRATGVIVQTESVAAWAKEFCDRVHVIPNFVERPVRFASPEVNTGPRRLVALGRLSPEKGFDFLIRAFKLVAARHPDWSLEIIGEGPERRRLETLVTSLGMEDRIRLPGRTSDPATHLAASHAFALPSRYEGFPNALLEAMACGLPAVAFACRSGPDEIIVHGRNGLLVPAGDVQELARALRALMSDPALRGRLGRNAREVATSLAPERIVNRWNGLLLELGPRPERTR